MDNKNDKKPLVIMKPMKPRWVQAIFDDMPRMRKEYQERQLRRLLDIALNRKGE